MVANMKEANLRSRRHNALKLFIFLILLPVALVYNPILQEETALAQEVIIRDPLGGIMSSGDPERDFYTHNPQYKGKKNIPEINRYQDGCMTKLELTVIEQDYVNIKRLLLQGADPNVIDCEGGTALEWAVFRTNLETVKLLVRYGAKATKGDPLQVAVTPEMIKYLKGLGAELYQNSPKISADDHHVLVDSYESALGVQDAIFEEQKVGHINPSIAQAVLLDRKPEEISQLLAEGSDINEVHPEFGSVLQQAFNQFRGRDYIIFLLNNGVDPNKGWGEGGWGLLEAVKDSDPVLVQAFLDHGAKIALPGTTPSNHILNVAINNGDVETVRILLKAGVDPNPPAKKKKGERYPEASILVAVSASSKPSQEIIKLLLDAGADPLVKDSEGNNALARLSWNKDNIPIALMLMNLGVSGSDPSILKSKEQTLYHWAIDADSQELFQAAKKARVNVATRDSHNVSPLWEAVSKGDPWFTRAFLSVGAPVNKSVYMPGDKYYDYSGIYKGTDDILGKAITEGKNLEVVEILLNAGVNINTMVNEYDQGAALHLAVIDNRPDMVAAILKARGKTEVKDRYKRTPLHVAVDMERVEIADMLVKAGANVNAKDEEGRTPLDYARWAKNREGLMAVLSRPK
jgi:ankyrin repeat protein